MCLAIPGRIIAINEDSDPLARTGQVEFSGLKTEVSLAYVPEAQVNDYVIIHAGFALSVLDVEEAVASLESFADFTHSQNHAEPLTKPEMHEIPE